jgi:hypothetical protein
VASSEAVALALAQAKFQGLAPMVRPLLAELEQRRGLDEYEQLLADCHNVYTDVRTRLLTPLLAASMFAHQQATSADVVAFVRTRPQRARGAGAGSRLCVSACLFLSAWDRRGWRATTSSACVWPSTLCFARSSRLSLLLHSTDRRWSWS